MKRPDYLNQIRGNIERAEAGSVFVSTDFTDITDKKTVNMGLIRLADEGLIKKILFGVYYKPEFSELLGEAVAPSPNKVAHALARNFGWTIVPCGDTALNLLGLSTQVPSQWVYVSDGAYKEYTFDNGISESLEKVQSYKRFTEVIQIQLARYPGNARVGKLLYGKKAVYNHINYGVKVNEAYCYQYAIPEKNNKNAVPCFVAL